MQARKYLLVGAFILANISLKAQDNGGCDDCPAFNASGKVEVRGIKERIIGDLSQPISVRVENLISKMTLEEKVAQLSNETDSIPRLNLPSYNYWNECLHGVARAGEVTVFPQAINLASTWDTLLIKNVASAISTEARLKYLEIGKGLTYWSPTINMARDPRWGRNEETYGEDPYLTSRLGVAFVKGLQGDHPDYLKTVATIKHFVANNQENDRFSSSSQIPTKQLYEYYFPAYEACVKEADAQSVMTAYNAFNGVAPSGSTWLLGDVLRKEWGFQGIVMTDWWAKSNYEGHQAEVTAKAPMVAAQNDIYMVVSDAKSNPENDDVEEMLHAGKITVGELQRNAANILGFLLKSPSVLLLADRICEEELEAMNTKEEDDVDAGSLVSIESDSVTQKIVIDGALLHPAKGKADVIAVTNEFMGDFTMKFTLKSDLGELAQLPVSVFLDNIHKMTVSVQGTNGKWVEESRILNMEFGHNHYIKFYYGADNLEIKEIVLIPNR